MANVAIVTKDKDFMLPSFDFTIAGTTSIKCLKHINEVMIPEGRVN